MMEEVKGFKERCQVLETEIEIVKGKNKGEQKMGDMEFELKK